MLEPYRTSFILSVMLLFFTPHLEASPAESLTLVEVTQSHMGMPVYLRVYASDEAAGQRACAAAFERIAELNQIFSNYEYDSELSRLNQQPPDTVFDTSLDLHKVLLASIDLARHTDGLFDPTTEPLTHLWRQARSEKRLPEPDTIKAALDLVGYQHLELDTKDRKVHWRRPGMQLDLGAIAKGYIGDQALITLREQGITRAMFEAGGDMVFADPPPGDEGWRIRPDFQTLPEMRLTNCAVAISGNTVQFMIIDGKRYGHIIDPRTGQSTETNHACLVVAPTGLQADPLATIGTMMTEQDFKRFINEHHPGVNTWVVPRDQLFTDTHTEKSP